MEYSTHMIASLDILSGKTKEELIAQATSMIRMRHPNIPFEASEYRARCWQSSSELKVSFERLICYTEPTARRIFNVVVNFVGNYIDPLDGPEATQFYIPAEADRKIIDLVKQTVGIGNGKYTDAFYIAEIAMDGNVVRVSIETDASFRILYLDKTTGEQVMSPLEGAYIIRTTPDEITSVPVWTEIH
jgi:hypothetical protein